jgi:hypothetical protein
MSDASRVTLVPDRGSQLTLILTADPDQAMPVGGFERSERLHRQSTSYFKAPSDGQMTLSLAVDTRLVGGPSIARRLQVLEEMGTRGEEDEPPKLKVISPRLPRVTPRTWVIATGGLKLGAQVTENGELVRQDFELTLDQYVQGQEIEEVRAGRTRTGATGKRRRRTIKTQKGDTLRAIAVRQLGSAGQWNLIREWNPKTFKTTDPDLPLAAGITVVLR